MSSFERPQSPQDPDSLGSAWTTFFWIFLGCFFVAFAVIVFRTPFELWDESRYANNAMEMVLSRDWMVLHYGGSVDRWITEPPALIWVFAGLLRAGVKLVYAVRIPGILAGLLTTITIYLTASRLLHRRFVAIAASLILLSSLLFFGPHVALNGDFDASLCLFITLGAVSLWAFFQDVDGAGTLWISLAAVALAVAILIKGFAGLQLLPGYLVYALIDPVARRKLADKRLWIALGLAICACGVYYLLRDRIDPEYGQRVLRNEVFGRVGSTIEGHVGGPFFHVRRMLSFFEPGFALTLVALFAFRSKWARDRQSFSLSLFCAVVSFVTIFLLSLSKTKLPYYTVNTEPLLALFAAIGLADLLRRAGEKAPSVAPRRAWANVAITVLFLFAVGSLALTSLRTAHRRRVPDMLTFVDSQHLITQTAATHTGLTVLEEEIADTPFSPHYKPFGQLIKNEAALQGIHDIVVVDNEGELQAGRWVVSCDKSLYAPLVAQHRVVVEHTNGTCIAGPVASN